MALQRSETRECELSLHADCREGRVALSGGIECVLGHFACSFCLEGWVMNSINAAGDSPGAMQTRQNDGKIHCACCVEQPKMMYDDVALARALRASVFEQYMQARTKVVEDKRHGEMEAEMRDTLAAELKRLLAMDEDQRAVHKARKDIEEELLQMRCPECKCAFLDFDGCFAVKCGR